MFEIAHDSLLCHNRRNQLMICDIKRWIIHFYVLWRHAFLVPRISDFLRWALFDMDVLAGGGIHVDGGGGGADVEGDAVVFGQDGDAGCADFVGNVAVGGDAVTADEDSVDPAVFHDGGCHVVTDECDIYAGSTEFVCGEACALEEGARFVGRSGRCCGFPGKKRFMNRIGYTLTVYRITALCSCA